MISDPLSTIYNSYNQSSAPDDIRASAHFCKQKKIIYVYEFFTAPHSILAINFPQYILFIGQCNEKKVHIQKGTTTIQ